MWLFRKKKQNKTEVRQLTREEMIESILRILRENDENIKMEEIFESRATLETMSTEDIQFTFVIVSLV